MHSSGTVEPAFERRGTVMVEMRQIQERGGDSRGATEGCDEHRRDAMSTGVVRRSYAVADVAIR